MVTFTINIPEMLAYIPYMDPMGNRYTVYWCSVSHQSLKHLLPSVALTWLWVEPSTTGAIPLFFRIVGYMSHNIPILAVLLIDYTIGKSRNNYLYAIRTQYTLHYDTWS